MADLSDVRTALVNLIDAAVYPNGDSAASATGYPTVIRPGWPEATALDADMAANRVRISVYPEQYERITTRFARIVTPAIMPTPTITIAAAKQQITIGGTITVGHYVSAVIFNRTASYAAAQGDTLSTVASAIAAQLTAAGVSATATGTVIAIPRADVIDIAVASGAPGTAITEVRKQQKSFLITIWAPSDEARLATANVVDPVLASTDYIGPFPDTTHGWLLHRLSNDSDESEKRSVFRRDLAYWVEYATTISETVYPITIFSGQIKNNNGTTNGATYTQNVG